MGHMGVTKLLIANYEKVSRGVPLIRGRAENLGVKELMTICGVNIPQFILLRQLESKLKMNPFTSRIEHQETSATHSNYDFMQTNSA